MRIEIAGGLPLVELRLGHAGRAVMIPRVLVDTGSGSTVLSSARAKEIGLVIDPHGGGVRQAGRLHPGGPAQV